MNILSRKNVYIGVGLFLGIIAPAFFYPVFLMKLLCFAIFASAFNLLIGFTGLLSFGHAAFFGGSAYAAGYIMRDLNVSTELAVIGGMLVGGLIGLVVGLLAIRRKGIYFTMITMAMAQMAYFFFLQARFTGGEDGFQGVPRGTVLGIVDLSSDLSMYYFVLFGFFLSIALIMRIVSSPFGQVLKAIKENEPRAISLGYQVNRYKLLVFVLSASLAGLAGALKTVVLGFATLTDVHWAMSGLPVLMTLVGGIGTILGPIVGAVVILVLENKLGDIGTWLAKVTHIDWFSTLGDSVTIVTGFIFVVCVLTFRRGIVGELLAWRKSKTR